MLLLVLGPLIGQLSAVPRDHHAAGEMVREPHAGHAVDLSASGMPPEAGDTAGAPAAHWHPVCGYCSLFQQMPVLSAMLPSVSPLASHVITAPVVATRAAHGGPAVFPQAPTRAPPLSLVIL